MENRSSAKDALQKSCYFKIDFGISEEATVYEAVQRFAAYNIGALAVTNEDKRVIGIVSERDYVSKVLHHHPTRVRCMFFFLRPLLAGPGCTLFLPAVFCVICCSLCCPLWWWVFSRHQACGHVACTVR